MSTRNWSIRSKITALVAVPLAALLALWVFATVLAAGPALNLLSARTLLDTVGEPGEVLVAELQQERRLAAVYLAGRSGSGALDAQFASTDRALAGFRTAATGQNAQDATGELLGNRIDDVFTALDGLTLGRGYIQRREVDSVGAHNLYSSMIDSAFRMFSAMATYDEPQIDRETRAVHTIGRGREWLSRADALLAAAYAAGRFTADQHGRLIQAIGTQQYLYSEAVADLPGAERGAYQQLVSGAAFGRLQEMQSTLVQSSRAGSPAPVPAAAWQAAYDPAVQQLRAFEINAADALADRAAPVAIDILLRPAVAGLVGLLAVVVSVLVSVRLGRSLIGRLTRLRATFGAAGDRLPSVVRSLQRGEAVDVAGEVPAVDDGTDEIGQLGRAFAEVHRTALQSAVDEAAVRRGVDEVFVNIARRSQTLLHRQLSLLDRMERRQTEPQELEDLYRVDSLATRMRRHAEDLVILAGAAPGRGWRNPVPVVDVVRGAISEIEAYKRIDVNGVEASSLVGRAVGDAIHLLAELLENAASFSPPNTRVQIAGQIVPNGYAVEIQDRGLGMSAEAIADANRRLLEPPDFDPADSARLGLFVVAKLADRHGIKVQLRPSPYGGVTAVTLIPGELITDEAGQPALTAGSAPPDRSWDRPAADVGTGAQGAAGSVPAALQELDRRPGWASAEGPKGNVAAVLPATIAGSSSSNGTAPNGTAPNGPAPGGTAPNGPASGGTASNGPALNVPALNGQAPAGLVAGAPPAEPQVPPSAPGLTADGLAQRRRIIPRPRSEEPEPSRSILDAPTVVDAPVVTRSAPRHAAATPPGAAEAGTDAAGEIGLPRRVRQANLVPQLRRRAEPEAEAAARSPEEVRTRMNALQLGTTRGRLAAAQLPPPPNQGAQLPPVPGQGAQLPPVPGPAVQFPPAPHGGPLPPGDVPAGGAAPGGSPASEPDAGPPEQDVVPTEPDDPGPAVPWYAGQPPTPDRMPGPGWLQWGEWGDADSHGYPLTRDAAGAAARAEAVVHYGEIVPRKAPERNEELPPGSATPAPGGSYGQTTQPEKDA